MAGQSKSAVDILLAQSFKKLAEQQPIEKITIKEITDRAGVIRPTFYNHFQDKYELLEWIISTELLEPVEPLIRNGMVNEAFVLLFTAMENDREFYTKAIRLEGQNSFADIAKECVQRVLLRVIKERAQGNPWRFSWMTDEDIAGYYAQSMCYMVIAWIQSGMSVSARELAEAYQYVLRHSMEDILSER